MKNKLTHDKQDDNNEQEDENLNNLFKLIDEMYPELRDSDDEESD